MEWTPTTAAHLRLPSDVSATDVGFVLAQTDGVFVHVNDAFCRLTGRAREELLGRRADGVAVSGHGRLRWILEHLPESGQSMSYQRTFESPDGPQLVEVTIHRAGPDVLAATFTRLSAAVGAADQRLLGAILEAVPVGVVVYDRAHRIVRMNRAVESLGRLRPEHLGTPLTEAFADVDSAVVQSIGKVFTTGRQIANQRIERDGQTFLLNFFPIRDEADSIVEVGCLYSDVSEAVVARQTIQAQEAVLRELSTPVLELDDHVLLAPLVGAMDVDRIRTLNERLLAQISAVRALVVILDVTGIPVIDTAVAHELLNTVAVARLMGSHVVMSGISTDHAEAITRLGVGIEGIDTVTTLGDAVAIARRESAEAQLH
jgi:PAS domain S-box-containing protein